MLASEVKFKLIIQSIMVYDTLFTMFHWFYIELVPQELYEKRLFDKWRLESSSKILIVVFENMCNR